MILTVPIKLLPTPHVAGVLKQTLETVNAACDYLSGLAWDAKEFSHFPMHKAFYKRVRAAFPSLASQPVIRLIAKVAKAYQLDSETRRTFRRHGSITYDKRILAFDLSESTVNIWTVEGRIKKLPFVCTEAHRKLLALQRGEATLVFHGGMWFLHVTVEVPDAQEREAVFWLGIDLGLVRIATDSDGRTYGNAKEVAGIRTRRWRQRKRLQRKGTQSARRVLNRLRGREYRFVYHSNHVISKQICAKAERTGRGVAMEDLRYIRGRVRARKSQRRILHSWAFSDLREKIAYKCRLVGVPVMFVDPRNSSRTCSSCGHVAKANRKTQARFKCESCGLAENADINAACVIAGRAAVDRPYGRCGVREHVRVG